MGKQQANCWEAAPAGGPTCLLRCCGSGQQSLLFGCLWHRYPLLMLNLKQLGEEKGFSAPLLLHRALSSSFGRGLMSGCPVGPPPRHPIWGAAARPPCWHGEGGEALPKSTQIR